MFLSDLTVRNTTYSNKDKNKEDSRSAPALAAIFIVWIVQIAFVFFLGNGIAYHCGPENRESEICITEEGPRSLVQSNAFVLWLM
jgi:hypothetical protein